MLKKNFPAAVFVLLGGLLLFILGSLLYLNPVRANHTFDESPLGAGGLTRNPNDVTNIEREDLLVDIRSSDFDLTIINRNTIDVEVNNDQTEILPGTLLSEYLPGVIRLTDDRNDTFSLFEYENHNLWIRIDGLDEACDTGECIGSVNTNSLTTNLILTVRDDTSFGDKYFVFINNGSGEHRWVDGSDGENFTVGNVPAELPIANSSIQDLDNINTTLFVRDANSRIEIVSTEGESSEDLDIFTACNTDRLSSPALFGQEGCSSNNDMLRFDLSYEELLETPNRIEGDYLDSSGNIVDNVFVEGGGAGLGNDGLGGVSGLANGAGVPSCETEIPGDLAWIGCSALRLADNTLQAFDETIDGLLKVESEEYSNPGYRSAWNNIRYLATISVVVTAMFMVISTALDFGFFSNYTVKKYIPRLVIGTIAIQLSWVIAGLSSDLVNELGDGIKLLLASPFGSGNIDSFSLANIFGANRVDVFGFGTIGGGDVGSAAAISGVGIVGSLGLFGALSVAYSGLIFLIIAYVFLVLRQIIIIALIVMSPIGVAFWILPGNDNAWNAYRKTFFGLLMLYPILVAMITIGKIFAYLAIGGGG